MTRETPDNHRKPMSDTRVPPNCCREAADTWTVFLDFPWHLLPPKPGATTDDLAPAWRTVALNPQTVGHTPAPHFCPFCGQKLPGVRKKKRPPPNTCRVSDDGSSCDTCHQPLESCPCHPPEYAWEPAPRRKKKQP